MHWEPGRKLVAIMSNWKCETRTKFFYLYIFLTFFSCNRSQWVCLNARCLAACHISGALPCEKESRPHHSPPNVLKRQLHSHHSTFAPSAPFASFVTFGPFAIQLCIPAACRECAPLTPGRPRPTRVILGLCNATKKFLLHSAFRSLIRHHQRVGSWQSVSQEVTSDASVMGHAACGMRYGMLACPAPCLLSTGYARTDNWNAVGTAARVAACSLHSCCFCWWWNFVRTAARLSEIRWNANYGKTSEYCCDMHTHPPTRKHAVICSLANSANDVYVANYSVFAQLQSDKCI